MGISFTFRSRLERNWDYPSTISFRTIKAVALRRANFTCEICNNPHNLFLHHIDGNARNNNNDNIIILCRYCHRQAHHNSQKEMLVLAKVLEREATYARTLSKTSSHKIGGAL